jgi:hypothetical protein
VIVDANVLVNVDGLYGIRFRIGPFEEAMNITSPALPVDTY